VRPKFCDPTGVETNDVYIESDNDGVEWAYMFMVGLHAKEELPQAACIVRNRNQPRAAAQQPVPPPAPPNQPRPQRPRLNRVNPVVSFDSNGQYIDADSMGDNDDSM